MPNDDDNTRRHAAARRQSRSSWSWCCSRSAGCWPANCIPTRRSRIACCPAAPIACRSTRTHRPTERAVLTLCRSGTKCSLRKASLRKASLPGRLGAPAMSRRATRQLMTEVRGHPWNINIRPRWIIKRTRHRNNCTRVDLRTAHSQMFLVMNRN